MSQVIFSGIQPSGTLHLGNYLGALKQWVALQAGNTSYFCIVDEHAITVRYDTKTLHERVLDTAAWYLATGVDPKHSVIFIQSHISTHTELAWLLGTITRMGELRRMTQFKDKAQKHREVATTGGDKEKNIIYWQTETAFGLFAYPILMAADILLYQANVVPVGEDQQQHIELTRKLAERFNNRFGETFTIPEALINKNSARVMSLTDPSKKMSKSDATSSYIALTDPPEVIRKKIMTAVTETEPVFSFEKSGPAVKNLLNIYHALSSEEPSAIEKRFSGKGYKEFKEALAELIIEKLSPLRKRYTELRQDEAELKSILGAGQAKAAAVAEKTLTNVKQKMGLA